MFTADSEALSNSFLRIGTRTKIYNEIQLDEAISAGQKNTPARGVFLGVRRVFDALAFAYCVEVSAPLLGLPMCATCSTTSVSSAAARSKNSALRVRLYSLKAM